MASRLYHMPLERDEDCNPTSLTYGEGITRDDEIERFPVELAYLDVRHRLGALGTLVMEERYLLLTTCYLLLTTYYSPGRARYARNGGARR